MMLQTADDYVLEVIDGRVQGWAVIDYHRGREYVLKGEPVPLRCVLQDVRDFKSLHDDIPVEWLVTPTGMETTETLFGPVEGTVTKIFFSGQVTTPAP